MAPPILMAVPNVSEGRDEQTIAALAQAFAGASPTSTTPPKPAPAGSAEAPAAGPPPPSDGVRLLDVHSDPDHHRSVFTLAGPPRPLAEALLRGARVAVERIDVVARAHAEPEAQGQHPHVGAIDVVPIVYLDPEHQGLACAEALVLADRIGHELQVPVFLYGELTQGDPGSAQAAPGSPARTRAELRRGGIAGLAARMSDNTSPPPDFGPPAIHPSAGAILIAARPPLVAFNLQLAPPATLADAQAIAALIREGGPHGLPGLRAIGIALGDGVAQVSMNVERPAELTLARIVEAVAAHAPLASAELVGLAPAAAMAGFPAELPILGFDPARHVIENALLAT